MDLRLRFRGRGGQRVPLALSMSKVQNDQDGMRCRPTKWSTTARRKGNSGKRQADTSGTGDSSLFDFSSLGLTVSSGNLSGVAWVGVAIAAALVWAAA